MARKSKAKSVKKAKKAKAAPKLSDAAKLKLYEDALHAALDREVRDGRRDRPFAQSLAGLMALADPPKPEAPPKPKRKVRRKK